MSKTNQIFVLFALSAFVMVLTSCDKDDKKDTDTFSRMNIEDAKSLFIAGSKMYGVKKTSLKSTSEMEGEIYEISYLDGNGKKIEKINPVSIVDAGDFVIVEFLSLDGKDVFFVKKTDGLIYAIPQEYFPYVVDDYNWSNRLFGLIDQIQLDKNKNIYYTNFPIIYPKRTLYKISSVASSAIQFAEVSAVNDKVTGFCVDDEGQIIYTYRPDNAIDDRMRYRKADGSFSNMAINDNDTGDLIQCIWKGTNGVMYGFMYTEWNSAHACLIKIQNGQITKIRDVKSNICSRSNSKFFRVQRRMIYCEQEFSDVNYIIDISNESLYKEIICPILPNMVLTDQLCYFDKEDFSCTLINIDTGETSLLYKLDKSKLNNYNMNMNSVFILSVSESGVVFSAMQYNEYVIAKMGLDNSVTILQNTEGDVSVILNL